MRRRLVTLSVMTAVVAAGALRSPVEAADPTCDGLAVTVMVTAERGAVIGTPGDDVILVAPVAGGGDTGVPWQGGAGLGVFGEDGNDSICFANAAADAGGFGGPGDDTILANEPGQPAIKLSGGPGEDVLHGSDQRDFLTGGSGKDVLAGEGGDDELIEGTAAVADDIFDGGAGVDEVDLSTLQQPVTIDFTTGTFSGFGEGAVSSVERWVGSAASDTLIGGDGDDTFSGGPGGDDHIVGGAGDDVLAGSDSGNDTILGGPGDDSITGSNFGEMPRAVDTLVGGPGDDFVRAYRGTVTTGSGADFFVGLGPVTAHLGEGSDRVSIAYDTAGPEGRTTVFGGPGAEHFVMSGGLDDPDTRLEGNGGFDSLRFGPEERLHPYILRTLAGTITTQHQRWLRFGGFERYQGAVEPDVMIGGSEPDVFEGTAGQDVLRGNGGADVLRGGRDRDSAFGGPGRDVCHAEVRHQCEAR